MKDLARRARSWITQPFMLVALGLLPCIFCLLNVVSNYQQHASMKLQIRSLHQKSLLSQLQTEWMQTLRERLEGADPDYVQNVLEKKTFLSGEVQKLEAIALTGKMQQSDQKRLNQLKSEANRLKLSETHFQRVRNWQEVEISQERAVEMGSEDLMSLLAVVENVPVGNYFPDPKAPDFLIDSFELTRKPQASQEETFAIKLHCIKREYIHE